MRRIASLSRRGVPVRRIRCALEVVRTRLPEVERPVEALVAEGDGAGRLLFHTGDLLCEPDGQLILDFDCREGGESGVSRLDARRPRRVDPECALAWFERGCRLDSDPRTHEQAIEAYERALQADPRLADASCNLGTIHQHRGDRRRARECYEAALRVRPGHVEANLNLAGLLEEEGRLAAALRRYQAALESDPLRPEPHLGLALLYERLELRLRARSHWRRYLQLDPRGAWAEIARRVLRGEPPPEPGPPA